MELEKVVKERDELKIKIKKWEESSNGLNKILNSQISAKDKNGLGYTTQLDEKNNKSKTDSEISMSVFEGTADISFADLDEYAIRKKIIESNTDTSKSKTNETNSDDEDDVSAVKTISPVKTNETQTVRNRVDKIGQNSQKEGIGFKNLKACFVCKSTGHLIKDCDFYAKRSPEPKMKTVVNTCIIFNIPWSSLVMD
ncbi:ribonuclease H-like domain-containing protein [Tanacetum coccineum]